MPGFIDLTGQRFGYLEVLERDENKRLPCGKLRTQWKVFCTRCNSTIFIVDGSSLKTGNTKSCGCSSGRSNKPGWVIWRGILRRCLNPSDERYSYYGGRGISIHPRWLEFDNFIKDVGTPPGNGLSLDRINNDGNYEPGNVRWATASQQARNRRDTVNLTFNGKTQCLKDWALELNKPYSILKNRYHRGCSVEDILLR